MCGRESRTGSSQSLRCRSRMLNPGSRNPPPPHHHLPPSYGHTCAHTSTPADSESAFRLAYSAAHTSLMHACTRRHAHNLVFCTSHCTLSLPYREIRATRCNHMCSDSLVILTTAMMTVWRGGNCHSVMHEKPGGKKRSFNLMFYVFFLSSPVSN